jgi:hypothetical protein
MFGWGSGDPHPLCRLRRPFISPIPAFAGMTKEMEEIFRLIMKIGQFIIPKTIKIVI